MGLSLPSSWVCVDPMLGCRDALTERPERPTGPEVACVFFSTAFSLVQFFRSIHFVDQDSVKVLF